ncbi:flagellar hook-length control protein FliK, partial [Pseudomonadota bacterium]
LTQQAAAPAKQAHNPGAQSRAQVTEQVTVQISKALNDGMDKIRIQLKPAHLGRVDVQLEMTQDGRVTAVISADNKDTLDLLKQDSRELERALREAGLDLNSGDLSFNMRGENGSEQEVADDKSGRGAPVQEPTLEELLDAQPGRRDIITEDRVDITA